METEAYMRIVQIGTYPLSQDCIRGGVEASVFGLSQEQARTSEVHVFDIPRIGGRNTVEQDGQVQVHRFCNVGKHQVSTMRLVKAIAEEIASLHPDVCHIHGTSLFSWLMYHKLEKAEQHVVVTIHGLVLIEKRNALRKWFSLKRLVQYLYQGKVEKKFLSHVPLAIVDTEYVRVAVSKYPIKKKPKMFVIPQGINESFFSMECSCDSNILLSVGAIGERKGHLYTLKAFELLRERGIDSHLVIAGTIASQAYFEEVCKVVNQSRYKEDIRLFTDLPDKELKEMYKSAHLFVLHSEEESQGIVFVEAMATGMPVVATNVGGVPCVVIDKKSGLLSEYANVDAFAENIGLLMTNVYLWRTMSSQAKEAAQDYRWSNVCETVMKLYQRID